MSVRDKVINDWELFKQESANLPSSWKARALKAEAERDETRKLLSALMRRQSSNPQMDNSHVCEVELLKVKEQRDRMKSALVQFSECNLSEDNCASFAVANARIKRIALDALRAEIGKGK